MADVKRLKLSNEAYSNSSGLQDEELMAEFARKSKARGLVVPTSVQEVKNRLREMGQPICLFGEGPAERRDRLRDFLSKLDEEALKNVNQKKTEGGGEAEEDEDMEIDQEVWYYPGPDQLRDARVKIAEFSMDRSKKRLKQERLQRSRPDPEEARKTQESYDNLREMINMSSQIGDTRPLSYCQFSPNGSLLATSSWSGLCKLWKVPDCTEERVFTGHNERVSCVVFHPEAQKSLSPSGANLFSSAADGSVYGWSLDKNESVCSFGGHDARVGRMAVHPSGDYLGTTCFDNSWRLFDIETQKEILHQEGHCREVYDISFQEDGALSATCGLDCIPRIWDLRSGKCITLLKGHVKQTLCVTFSPNGYQLATGGGDNSLKLWDLRLMGGPNAPGNTRKMGTLIRADSNSMYTIPAHTNIISSIKYQPGGGKFLVSSSYDTTLKVWANQSWAPLCTLEGHEGKVMHMDISSGKERGHPITTLVQQSSLKEKLNVVNEANNNTDILAPFVPFQKYEKNGICIKMQFETSSSISKEMLETVFNLLKTNMQKHYEESDWGWSDARKRAESRDTSARYILALNEDGELAAFAHFRFELEGIVPVIYCYEIQVDSQYRSKGLGKFMMKLLELIGLKSKMEKLMLTVFKANEKAIDFYRTKLNYEIDPSSFTICDPLNAHTYCHEVMSRNLYIAPKV
eukprot:Nk52_evm32s221 gene=Nk52_evmTU32s221